MLLVNGLGFDFGDLLSQRTDARAHAQDSLSDCDRIRKVAIDGLHLPRKVRDLRRGSLQRLRSLAEFLQSCSLVLQHLMHRAQSFQTL